MSLYREILINSLEKEKNQILLSSANSDLTEIVESKCYVALQQIKEILEDDSLEDENCFMKIEKIVCLFEELGSDCANRHDFG